MLYPILNSLDLYFIQYVRHTVLPLTSKIPIFNRDFCKEQLRLFAAKLLISHSINFQQSIWKDVDELNIFAARENKLLKCSSWLQENFINNILFS